MLRAAVRSSMREPPRNDQGEESLARIASKGWVSLRQVAALTGRTYQTVLKWKKSGKIKAVQVGGTWRVYDDELKRFLAYGNAVIGDSGSDDEDDE